MKIDVVKLIVALAISALIGLICLEMAKGDPTRQWVSFAVSTLSIGICLGMAVALKYNDANRSINIKTTAWCFAFLAVVTNIVFNCFTYNVAIYIAVAFIVTLIGVALVYSLLKSDKDRQ